MRKHKAVVYILWNCFMVGNDITSGCHYIKIHSCTLTMKITLHAKQVMLDVIKGHQIISGAVDADVLKKEDLFSC